MKKVALIFAVLLLLLPLVVSAQVIVNDDANGYAEWTAGFGDWDVRGGMYVQRDTKTGLARAIRMAPQSGELEYSFKVRYEAGGFDDQAALRAASSTQALVCTLASKIPREPAHLHGVLVNRTSSGSTWIRVVRFSPVLRSTLVSAVRSTRASPTPQ